MAFINDGLGPFLDTLATVANKTAIKNGRIAAGADYVAKVTALATARVELGAYDLACRNGNMFSALMVRHSAGFSMASDFTMEFPFHGEFLREMPGGGDINGRAYERHRQLVAPLNGTLAPSATLIAARNTAGAAYATALGNFLTSLVELWAYDNVCKSEQFLAGRDSHTHSFYYRVANDFNKGPDMMRLVHMEFAPPPMFMTERQVVDAINTRFRQLVATIATT